LKVELSILKEVFMVVKRRAIFVAEELGSEWVYQYQEEKVHL